MNYRLIVKNRIDAKMTTYYLEGQNEKVVIFFHGGAFVSQPLIFHWAFFKLLNKKTKATVYFPIYPLAPNNTYKKTYSSLINLYKSILRSTDAKNITLIGDSAGGTIAIGMCLLLKEKGLPLPNKVITLSACFDITFSNPEIKKLEHYDPMLGAEGCKLMCSSWAGNNNIKQPLVSPIYGDLSNLPTLHIFIGTNDILWPDTKLFVEKAKKSGCSVFYYEKTQMPHVFPLYPIPEGKEARDLIINIIK